LGRDAGQIDCRQLVVPLFEDQTQYFDRQLVDKPKDGIRRAFDLLPTQVGSIIQIVDICSYPHVVAA
jgi:hypothetical protein